MDDISSERSLVPIKPQKLKKVDQQLEIRRQQGYKADYVPHWGLVEVKALVEVTTKERDKLLVQFLFDSCCRISEALSVRPQDILQVAGGWQVRVLGKGKKHSAVAVSASLIAQLQAYAYRKGIKPDDRIFTINPSRAFQIIKAMAEKAGLVKPGGVGMVHILRHSGAIERLRRTNNPKAVQDQLRHSTAYMTMRYFKTLSHEESMAIQQEVDYRW